MTSRIIVQENKIPNTTGVCFIMVVPRESPTSFRMKPDVLTDRRWDRVVAYFLEKLSVFEEVLLRCR